MVRKNSNDRENSSLIKRNLANSVGSDHTLKNVVQHYEDFNSHRMNRGEKSHSHSEDRKIYIQNPLKLTNKRANNEQQKTRINNYNQDTTKNVIRDVVSNNNNQETKSKTSKNFVSLTDNKSFNFHDEHEISQRQNFNKEIVDNISFDTNNELGISQRERRNFNKEIVRT